MSRCVGKDSNGHACNKKSTELSFFWFHDPHGRIDDVFYMCELHIRKLIDDLMIEENGYKNLMKACFKQIKDIDEKLNHGTSVEEERRMIREAREQGLAEPKFDKVEDLKARKNELYKQISNTKKVLVILRNKKCRFCWYPLKEPEFPNDQLGNKLSVIDFKGVQGYRRLDALMHTECAITWIANKIVLNEKQSKYIQPKRKGQHTIFSSTPDLIINTQ